jgi:excisionase family DNA binding protein
MRTLADNPPGARGDVGNSTMNTAPIDPLAYSVHDACRVSSIGRTKLYALIAEGRLEARRIGGRTLIPAASLRRLIEGEA